MSDYQSSADLRLAPQLMRLAPREGKAFVDFNAAAMREDGLLPLKTREMIALAVALTTRCAYCLDVHGRGARDAGVSREELAELISIAAAVGAGATAAHGLLALRLFDGPAAAAP